MKKKTKNNRILMTLIIGVVIIVASFLILKYVDTKQISLSPIDNCPLTPLIDKKCPESGTIGSIGNNKDTLEEAKRSAIEECYENVADECISDQNKEKERMEERCKLNNIFPINCKFSSDDGARGECTVDSCFRVKTYVLNSKNEKGENQNCYYRETCKLGYIFNDCNTELLICGPNPPIPAITIGTSYWCTGKGGSIDTTNYECKEVLVAQASPTASPSPTSSPKLT